MSKASKETFHSNGRFPDWLKKYRQEIHGQLKKLAVKEPWIEELEQTGISYIAKVLAEYQIEDADLVHLLPTYFIPHQDREKLTELIKISEEDEGRLLASVGVVLVMIHHNFVSDVYTYFHETIHSVGKVAVWHSEQKILATRVGYSYIKRKGEELLERGNFLEESAVDWLAAQTTVLYLTDHGYQFDEEPKPERQVIAAGPGKPYLHMRNCLNWLTDELPELRRLWLATRFNFQLIHQFAQELNKTYGPGTLSLLNWLSVEDPNTSDEVVLSLKPFDRSND